MSTDDKRQEAQASKHDGATDYTPVAVVIDVLGGKPDFKSKESYQFCHMRGPDPVEMLALGWLQAEQAFALLNEALDHYAARVPGDALVAQRITGWRLRLGELMGRG